MGAKNYRIGNLVNYVTKDNAKARAVDAELLMNWKDNCRMYKPITLTEEWLNKLGFILTKGGTNALKSKLIIVYKCSKCNHIKERVHTNFSSAWD